MQLIESVCLAFVLDLLIGDPAWIPHPVVLMGKCITGLEAFLRAGFPDSPEGERAAGRILAVILPAGTFAVTSAILWLCLRIHPAAAFVLNTFWCAQALAVRDMLKESRNTAREVSIADTMESAAVMREDGTGDSVTVSAAVHENSGNSADDRGDCGGDFESSDIWDGARKAVGRIVGRDTAKLDKAGIVRATVETVAENFSDGVFAPLMYMMIGGAPLALTYKAVNTMDSMIGYKNSRYLYFGRAAAKLDDAANFIPARLAAMILILSVRFCEGPEAAASAFRIWRRDRLKHPSPNSAQTESVMAGALGVRLLGPTWYFGKLYEKSWIGDDTREIETKDIARAGRIFLLGSVLSLIVLIGIRLFFTICIQRR